MCLSQSGAVVRRESLRSVEAVMAVTFRDIRAVPSSIATSSFPSVRVRSLSGATLTAALSLEWAGMRARAPSHVAHESHTTSCMKVSLFVDGTAARKPSLGLLSPAKSSQFSALMYGVVFLSPRPLSDTCVCACPCSRTVDEAKLLLLPE